MLLEEYPQITDLQLTHVSSDEDSNFEYTFQLDDPLTKDEWVARKRLCAHTPPPEYS